jgi:hypothetical protein
MSSLLRRRLFVTIAAVVLLGAADAVASTTATAKRVLAPCAASTLHSSFPVAGSRTVLPNAAVPPRDSAAASVGRVRQGPWRYFLKGAVFLRNGSGPVTATIPPAWRSRVAISWGNDGFGDTVKFTSCPAVVPGAYGWTGGFYFNTRGGCVPVIFSSGKTTRRVIFGLGGSCK